MKSTKSFMITMMALLVTLLVSSCTKDDPNPLADSIGDLALTPTEMTFSVSGGTETFTVQGGTPFVRSEADWLTVAKDASVYTVACAENETDAPRTGTILVNLYGAFKRIIVNQNGPVNDEVKEYTFRSAGEVAKDMYPGWNLGNTLEACGSTDKYVNKGLALETSWQPTQTTQQVIDAVKAAGFKSVRIPCAWVAGHATGSGTEPVIDKTWIARVKEVVDYCVNAGLYVVINDHWDGGWIEVEGFSSDASKFTALSDAEVNSKVATLKNVWTQIAEALKGYDEHVIFAGLNEPFQEYSLFSTRHEALTPILMKYNKAFVEAVRATGGNNANRVLVVQGPSVNIASTCSYMDVAALPEQAGKLMVEVHYYDPGQFCGTYDASGDKAFYYWGAANQGADHNTTWGDESYMYNQFSQLSSKFTSKGFPVIIGEYAGLQRNLNDAGDQAKHDASVKYYYEKLNEYAVNNGIVAFAWDTNDVAGLGKESGSSTIIGRKACKVVGVNAMEGILAGSAAGVWPY